MKLSIIFALLGALCLCWAAWIAIKATAIRDDLGQAAHLAEKLREEVAASDSGSATRTVFEMRKHTIAAKQAADDPLWTLASGLPWAGPNFSAVAEVARAADDVVGLALEPLADVYEKLDWGTLLPSTTGTDLGPLSSAAPSVSSAAYAVRISSDRLTQIDTDRLVPQISQPLAEAAEQLQQATGALNAAADASRLMPLMLGAEEPRDYLLIIQNNAESRASGGIPGALAVLNLDKGKMTLGAQSTATDLGVMQPSLPVEREQQQIYSGRLGKFMQDINLTPDFPTAASTAQAMWERKTGQRVHGVVSIDPVALGYILDAAGPAKINDPEVLRLAGNKLPTELTGDNVVSTLLSAVYANIEEPERQDAYFAGVASEIFATLSNGKSNASELTKGLTRGAEEGRVLVWSGAEAEQSLISKYALSGSISGPSVSPAQFGVYFNDGTGAKMDYYTKRTVQLIKGCPHDGYEETTVRITSTNTAPGDAATSLPPYVTGDGLFGVPPGSVQTNLVAYGPAQAHVEAAKLDGQKTEFAPYFHGNRPVGVLAIRLAPGESKTVDFTFGKIVQHTEPNVVVTPTVQDVKDVTLPTETAACG
ncbi:DUF4012 domain-containing protein [Pseudarthrobacter sp. NCCP-2145]|uniref:DUF4012 domain-containing protein n=1 Tax=Pseudarthrobacter sp. NCCP-2145 TaxID=2942290 RepID=UPI00203B0A38|nr:DUF4012 domain-containing protein [Pseudarthrobacter sp. NCCP-2145]GKV72787.1 hypothetical protein NCCP2145_21680 [Pseudarthrobacter sp. NCCP-2145]